MISTRVFSRDFDPRVSWDLNQQLRAIRAAKTRRLQRVWKVGLLPHEICQLMDIPSEDFVQALAELEEKGVDLRPDHRTEPDFLKVAGNSKVNQRVSEKKLQILIDDYLFYSNKTQLSRAMVARLLECPQHYINYIREKAGLKSDINEDISLEERNQEIVRQFKNRKGEYGIKSSLAREFNLSRKSIDLVLEAAGVGAKVTKSKPRPKSNDVKIRNKAIAKEYIDSFIDGKPRRGVMSYLSGKYNITSCYLTQILKKEGVFVPIN